MMTITEKILARAAGKATVAPGESVWVKADVLLTHDVCGPGTIGVFKREFGDEAKVFSKDGIVIMPDHYIHTKDEKAHRNIDIDRAFVKEQGLPHFYDPGTPGYVGVCHVGLPEKGHVRPGMVIFGTDSHTCTHGALGAFATGIGNTDAGFVMGTGKLLIKVPHTLRFVLNGHLPPYVTAKDVILRIIGDIGVDGATYCAMEFRGQAIDEMSVEERMTLCNMAVEAGAKSGIVPPDAKTLDYVRAHTGEQDIPLLDGDPDAPVLATYTYDVSTFVPCVAKPHLPENYAPASACRDVKVDQVYIGSCTGGKTEDFLWAAKILKGRKVAVRTCLVPATCQVMHDLTTLTLEGQTLEQIFVNAGCEPIQRPSCGACLGGPVDTYARTKGTEVVVSTTNRNFIGRMGSKDAPIYLASPATAAATAIAGHIESPWAILGLDRPEPPRTPPAKQDGHPNAIPPAAHAKPVSDFKVTGKVYVLGDNIDTDLIIPTMYLNLVPTIPEEYRKLGSHALAGLPDTYPTFSSNPDGTTPYAILIAGKNFGCGSSREHAPIAIGAAGCKAVVAESYARIYFRNAVASGEVFPLETPQPLTAEFKTGDEATLDLAAGTLTRLADGKTFPLAAADAVAPVIAAGGLFNYARQTGKRKTENGAPLTGRRAGIHAARATTMGAKNHKGHKVFGRPAGARPSCPRSPSGPSAA